MNQPVAFKKIADAITHHLTFSCLKTSETATQRDWYEASALGTRDQVVARWVNTMTQRRAQNNKHVYYLSLEFLIGRMLGNAALNLGIAEALKTSLEAAGVTHEDVLEEETDAALGNGGLGRLAACFIDSMATMNIPATGYGIRYDYGMFKQLIEGGEQAEQPDHWLRYRNLWEFQRPEIVYAIKLYGKVVDNPENSGTAQRWTDFIEVNAQAYDMPVPGYHSNTVNHLRLWSAKAPDGFDLAKFNEGHYEKAVEKRHIAETISQVLYPNDQSASGKELRLKQQYFFVSASIQDILYGFVKQNHDWTNLPEKVTIQLNDTHPAIAVAELMYQLVDIHNLSWEIAWHLVNQVFAYTNHTLMPEALETWSVDLFSQLLPRHLEIIYEINHRFLQMVNQRFPNAPALLANVSIIEETHPRRVRMAHLAVVGSHTVNGVAALHSELLKNTLFADFHRIFPEKFTNITNGITPRRWLNQANPVLSRLIGQHIGHGFERDLSLIKHLEPLADDASFRQAFRDVKKQNKVRLAQKIKEKTGIIVSPNAMFDVQIKRIHEYKRQLLNLLHVITCYNLIREGKVNNPVPRVVIFAGKAAPGYWLAKLIVRLINDVAHTINHDPAVGDLLKVVFYPNYEVSAAEVLVPAADLSEQISTAGTEASGTGNMKMALNGALTIGTLDGANIEIKEEVGEENIFIFGLTTAQVLALKAEGYDPMEYYRKNQALKQVIDMIHHGFFSKQDPHRYHAIIDNILHKKDTYLLLADYQSYIDTQAQIDTLYRQPEEWTRKCILNVARMGKFSSDRTISEYAKKIWGIHLAQH